MFEHPKNFSSNPNIPNVITPDQGSSRRELRKTEESKMPTTVLVDGDELEREVNPRKISKLRRNLLIGMVGVGTAGTAGLIALSLFAGPKAAEAPVDTTDPNKGPDGTSEVVPLPTYQDEIAAALEARNAEVPASIPVEGRAVTAEDAVAWVAAKEACLQAGNIPFTTNARTAFIATLGTDTEAAKVTISDAFQLSANYDKCTSGLVSSDPAAVEISASSKSLNVDMVQQQLFGRQVTVEYVGEPEINILDDTTISISQNLNRIVTDNGTPYVSDGLSGGTLRVENGELKLVGPVTH